MNKRNTVVGALAVMLLVSLSLAGQTKPTAPARWLMAGPVVTALPVFDTLPDVNGKKFDLNALFTYMALPHDTAQPKAEGTSPLGKKRWKSQPADKGKLLLANPAGALPELWLAAVYVTTPRFVNLKLKINSSYRYEVWIDGEKTSSGKPSDTKAASDEATVKLVRGKHRMIVKLIVEKKNRPKDEGFSLETENPEIDFTLIPTQPIDLARVLEGPSVSGCDMNHDGSLYRIDYRTVVKGEGQTDNESVIYTFSDNKPLWRNRHDKASNIQFTPDGQGISYLLKNAEDQHFVIENLTTIDEQRLAGFDKVNDYSWSPNGRFLVYSIDEDGPKETDITRRIENPNDRWPWYRNRSLLALYDFETGQHERITWGYLSTSLEGIAHDGSFILFTTSEPDFNQRPYSRQQLFRLDLTTRAVTKIWDMAGGAQIVLSPDDKTLLVTGSATLFNQAGNVLPDDVIPNEYNTQAYLYDLSTGVVKPLTRDFKPKITDAAWIDKGTRLALLTENRTRADLYTLDLATGVFKKIAGEADVTAGMATASDNGHTVAFGTSVSSPSVAFTTTLTGDEPKLVAAPAKEWFDEVVFGLVSDFAFTSRSGDTIDGMVFYPPDFDPTKKYPVIVYYYGGTNPINRAFEGRYPKNLFASMGYIVYTLNPDGCTGYGAEFAARHVNNWGITTADQIIEGTRKFLRSQPAADSTRVGCIGASYGGFMTMLLQTRTKLFRTAISHAGISNISSYWGEGYWGYLYSSAATAGKFPWNAPDLYTRQSPLYNADKVTTPILLLHGNKDTNVPTSESRQLFTALKVLGKQVELIEFDGQDHQILSYKPRIKWQNTIFAWFDKWLKDEPAWWNELYPERRL